MTTTVDRGGADGAPATVSSGVARRRVPGTAKWQRPGGAAVRQWGLVLVPVALVVAMAWDRRWMADDGFLHLRVVDQVLHGNGPVFNAGERVETSTSPLWVGLLTLLSFVTDVALPWKAVVAGLVLTAIGMVAAARAAMVLGRAAGATGVVWPVGLVAVAALPPVWDYATSGLETGLAFGWIGASCWWVAVRATRPTSPSLPAEVGGAVLVSLGFTVRPDLAVFTVVLGAVLVVACRPAWRRGAAVVAGLAAVPVLDQVFRMGYYAMVVPNTAVTKEASVAQWGPGWRYLTDLVAPYALWLPAAAVAVILWSQVAADRGRGARLVAAARLAPVAAALVHALYITRVGGDFMHARLLLPALFGLLAPIGLALGPTRDRRRGTPVVVAAAVTAGWALLATFLLRPSYTDDGNLFTTGDTIEDERRLWQVSTGMEHPVRNDVRARQEGADAGLAPVDGRASGLALDNGLQLIEVPLRADVDVSSAGIYMQPAYAWDTDVYVIDTAGLAHPVGGHLDELSGTRMGHQKSLDLAWQLAGWTPVHAIRGEDGEVLVTRESLAAAEQAMSCGRLGAYLEDIRSPLTPSRFLRNLRDSFANTSLRVPADPRDAHAELCDG